MRSKDRWFSGTSGSEMCVEQDHLSTSHLTIKLPLPYSELHTSHLKHACVPAPDVAEHKKAGTTSSVCPDTATSRTRASIPKRENRLLIMQICRWGFITVQNGKRVSLL